MTCFGNNNFGKLHISTETAIHFNCLFAIASFIFYLAVSKRDCKQKHSFHISDVTVLKTSFL